MSKIQVRQATMGDTNAICALFRQRIGVWQRFDSEGRVEELPYQQLTIYERWLHGGAWMSIETGAIFLSHLLTRGALAIVAETNGDLVGYAEAYPGHEPAPYGTHLHIAHLVAHPDQEKPVKDALMQHLLQPDAKRLTVAFSSYDHDTAAFYQQYGMQSIGQIRQYTLPAHTGQSFYKAVDCHQFDQALIDGWEMPVGRTESARQHWETLWSPLWGAFPQITAQATHRLRFSASGQDAFICFQQQLYTPRCADVYCWSPKSLTKQLLIAICDWAYRENYRSLAMAVPETTAQLFSTDGEETPYRQDIYAIDL